MLNAYPDSLGGNLSDIANFLSKKELKDVFSSFYILPSLFHTDLDRGFSVIDYSLNEMLAKKEDLEKLDELGIDLKLDFILNHASVLSKQFQDIIKNGEKSKYRDFFIDWNKFWAGCGEMTEEGYIQPKTELIKDMFFRKPGLPILMVRFPDGKEVPFMGEDKEYLVKFARAYKQSYRDIDFFLFGHRHIELDLAIDKTTRMLILGDWIWQFTYAVFDGEHLFMSEYAEGETKF